MVEFNTDCPEYLTMISASIRAVNASIKIIYFRKKKYLFSFADDNK